MNEGFEIDKLHLKFDFFRNVTPSLPTLYLISSRCFVGIYIPMEVQFFPERQSFGNRFFSKSRCRRGVAQNK